MVKKSLSVIFMCIVGLVDSREIKQLDENKSTDLESSWSDWGSWSWCFCDVKLKVRERQCRHGLNKQDVNCKGHSREAIDCDEECPDDRTEAGDLTYLYFRRLYVTHDEAASYCERFNGSLAVIKDFDVYDEISKKIASFPESSRSFHVGLRGHSDIRDLRNWKWADNTRYNLRFNRMTRMSYFLGKAECAAIQKFVCDRLFGPLNCWMLTFCSDLRPFICGKAVSSSKAANKTKGQDRCPQETCEKAVSIEKAFTEKGDEEKSQDRCPRQTCKKVTSCPILPVHYNGTSFPVYRGNHRFKAGESVRFFCETEQFQMIGNSTLTCLEKGLWSSEIPLCINTTDCEFSSGPEGLCWYRNALSGNHTWVSVPMMVMHVEWKVASAWNTPAILESHPFTAKNGSRCLKFKYRLFDVYPEYPWLEVTVGNITWMRAGFDRRGRWRRGSINISQTDEGLVITFHAKSGRILIRNVEVLLETCARQVSLRRPPVKSRDRALRRRISKANDPLPDDSVAECNFNKKSSKLCSYMSSGGIAWERRGLCRCKKWDYVARASVYGEKSAGLRSPLFQTGNKTKCLRFQYMMQSPPFIVPRFIVVIGRRRWSPSNTTKDAWLNAEVNVRPKKSLIRIRFFVEAGTVSLDNIAFENSLCSSKQSSIAEHKDDSFVSTKNKEKTRRYEEPSEVQKYGDYEYLFFPKLHFSHRKATRYCCKLGASLAKIRSTEAHYFLQDILLRQQMRNGSTNYAFRIGMSSPKKHEWRWHDLEHAPELYRTPISQRRPYEAWLYYPRKHRQNCVGIIASYICQSVPTKNPVYGRYKMCWRTNKCRLPMPFICERKLASE